MKRGARKHIPLWKQAVAIACLLYATLVWVLPVFMLPFFNVLPFEHEKTFLERLPFSLLGSALVILATVMMNRRSLTGSVNIGDTLQTARHWSGILGGLVMFTLSGTALSANLWGSLTKIIPDHSFTLQTTLEAVDYSGSRYKSMKLEYKDVETGGLRYLTLSRRLFDYPELRPGNVVVLHGKETAVGRYIEVVTLLR
jgi:hypothetical protein